MKSKPIYLTTNRLLYNMARVDHRNGRISDEELKLREELWEREYNDPMYEQNYQKKYTSNKLGVNE
jgi:hypothetical protein